MVIAVPERVKAIMAMLTHAAEMSYPCPTNGDIAERIGACSDHAASDAVALLETMGLITVVRGRRARVVTICRTGKSTGGIVRKPRVREMA